MTLNLFRMVFRPASIRLTVIARPDSPITAVGGDRCSPTDANLYLGRAAGKTPPSFGGKYPKIKVPSG